LDGAVKSSNEPEDTNRESAERRLPFNDEDVFDDPPSIHIVENQREAIGKLAVSNGKMFCRKTSSS
jgi:hypothetical protein